MQSGQRNVQSAGSLFLQPNFGEDDTTKFTGKNGEMQGRDTNVHAVRKSSGISRITFGTAPLTKIYAQSQRKITKQQRERNKKEQTLLLLKRNKQGQKKLAQMI